MPLTHVHKWKAISKLTIHILTHILLVRYLKVGTQTDNASQQMVITSKGT